MRYIDTNVILRFLTDKNPNKRLVDLFARIERGEEEVRCIDMVFFQVVFVLKSFYKIEKGKIIDVMRKLLCFKGLKMKDKQTIERTLDLWEKHQDDIVDCYIVARMEEEGASEIYSFDRKIERLGVRRIDP
ncbi:PIN domain-containing protein [Hippea sp. KM1]|uniref:PIN domain-containing protein n=1 Tax=Hippea sp. KM1 TaxID=944481 RepID=UPI00046D38A5|nr:PIN domain-containing protein [Hippea sp. KM1]